MLPDENPLPPSDHNRPPSPVVALVAEQKDALVPFAKRRDELVASASRVQVFDRASAGDAADVIRIANEVFKKIDQDRLDRSNPYRQAADAAKGVVDEFWQAVADALDELRARLNAWTEAEDKRIADQQAEQEAAMNRMREEAAATQLASASPARSDATTSGGQPVGQKPFRRRIRGDLGATLTTAEQKQYRVSDIKLVPDWIMATPTVHNAIIQVVKSMAKHAGEIPGIEQSTVSANKIQ